MIRREKKKSRERNLLRNLGETNAKKYIRHWNKGTAVVGKGRVGFHYFFLMPVSILEF